MKPHFIREIVKFWHSTLASKTKLKYPFLDKDEEDEEDLDEGKDCAELLFLLRKAKL